jgi:hypothetical protein
MTTGVRSGTGLNCWTGINMTDVGFEVFTAVVMKSIIFWDMTASYPRR